MTSSTRATSVAEPTAVARSAGRSRELELRLEALRLAIVFLDTAMMQELLGSAERFAGLAGRTQGERELLMHVVMHRFLTGGSAAAVLEPLERAVADGTIVAALGPDSMLLPFVIGQVRPARPRPAARRGAARGERPPRVHPWVRAGLPLAGLDRVARGRRARGRGRCPRRVRRGARGELAAALRRLGADRRARGPRPACRSAGRARRGGRCG